MIGGSPCLRRPAAQPTSSCHLSRSSRPGPSQPRCQALNMLENKRHARTSFETFWRIKMQIYYKKQKISSNPSIFLVWRLLWRMQKEGISQEFKYVQIWICTNIFECLLHEFVLFGCLWDSETWSSQFVLRTKPFYCIFFSSSFCEIPSVEGCGGSGERSRLKGSKELSFGHVATHKCAGEK